MHCMIGITWIIWYAGVPIKLANKCIYESHVQRWTHPRWWKPAAISHFDSAQINGFEIGGGLIPLTALLNLPGHDITSLTSDYRYGGKNRQKNSRKKTNHVPIFNITASHKVVHRGRRNIFSFNAKCKLLLLFKTYTWQKRCNHKRPC